MWYSQWISLLYGAGILDNSAVGKSQFYSGYLVVLVFRYCIPHHICEDVCNAHIETLQYVLSSSLNNFSNCCYVWKWGHENESERLHKTAETVTKAAILTINCLAELHCNVDTFGSHNTDGAVDWKETGNGVGACIGDKASEFVVKVEKPIYSPDTPQCKQAT